MARKKRQLTKAEQLLQSNLGQLAVWIRAVLIPNPPNDLKTTSVNSRMAAVRYVTKAFWRHSMEVNDMNLPLQAIPGSPVFNPTVNQWCLELFRMGVLGAHRFYMAKMQG